MPRSSSRDQILDAFVELLIDQGERAATLEAVAGAANVSKGGLLYHFGNKAALTEGLLERLRELAAEDRAAMAEASDGSIGYYLRTSAASGSDLERVMLAAMKLSDAAEQATQTLSQVQQGWFDLIFAEVGDPTVAQVIMLVGDGMYYNTSLHGSGIDLPAARHGVDAEDIRAALERLR
ncbi:TetR/AcrR family transcriptional regulator [Acaricomes phytoseiuli]|uniref:TetR/AcrR family transcriptional regulator n=1 Tax=Acaricomes phytoseiuli TaxID=291968 RepID=UPI0003602046|nr:helix-turn-helix domain-containing protein [Acaricomes phytoseiuli]